MPPVIDGGGAGDLDGDGDPSTISFEINTKTNYSGYTSTDSNGNVVAAIVQGDDADITKLGVYSVVLEAVDSSGNVGTINLTVTIKDTVPPIIVLPEVITVEINKTADYSVVKATDNSKEPIAVSKPNGIVDSTTVGDYNVTFSATDSSGNTTEKSTIVRVSDIVPPVIDGSEVGDLDGDGDPLTISFEVNTATDYLGYKATDEKNSQRLASMIKEIFSQIQIPLKLRDLGVLKEDFDWIIENTKGGSVNSNPRTPDPESLRELLEKAW